MLLVGYCFRWCRRVVFDIFLVLFFSYTKIFLHFITFLFLLY